MATATAQLRTVTAAVCPPTCSGLHMTCVQSLEGLDCSGVLFGDRSGLITSWSVNASSGSGEVETGAEAGASILPQLLLSGHDAEVTTLATAYPGNTGTPLVVSISADGTACAWQAAGASCLARQRLGMLPTRGWVLLPDGHHICFSCRRPHVGPSLPSHPGAPSQQRQQQHLLAVMEPLSLTLKGLLAPVDLQQLPVVAADPGACEGRGNLALRVLALPTKTVALGVSTGGQLVTWDFSRLADVASGQPLSPPTTPPMSPRSQPQPHPCPQLKDAAALTALHGSLVGASFSEDATLLLLVCSGGWALLQAANWEGQDAPTYSRTLHAASSAESLGLGRGADVGDSVPELAGGVILSGAMSADRTRVDPYYAGTSAEGAVETVVLWRTDGSIVFTQVAYGADPPRMQPVAVVPPAGSRPCSSVHIAFLGSSRFVRLCSFDASWAEDSSGASTSGVGGAACQEGGCVPDASHQLSVFFLPYLFPSLAASGSGGSQGGFPLTLEPQAHTASLDYWGASAASGAAATGGSACLAGGVAGREPCVTVAALAGSNSHAAEFVAQGMSDGSIQLWPLIAYAVPHLGSRSPRAELKGHSGMVVCLQELPAPHQGTAAAKLLLSGASDGSVCGWDLGSHPVGERLFGLHAHTDKVLQLVPAPAGQPPPWDDCVASIGADGAVALLSLRSGSCERLLHSPPGCLPHTLAWDLGRGYLAAVGAQQGSSVAAWSWGNGSVAEEGDRAAAAEQPVFLLWDVDAGSLDRAVVGSHAAAAMQTFLNGRSLSRQHQQQQAAQHDQLPSPPLSPGMAGGGSSSSSSLSRGRPSMEGGEAPRQAFAPSRPFISASSIPHHSRDESEEAASKCLLAHGVLLLDVDVHGLLHSREPLAGLAPRCGGSPRSGKPAPASCVRPQSQERLPAISSLDLRSSSSRASLDRAQQGGGGGGSGVWGGGMHRSESGSVSGRSTPAPPSPAMLSPLLTEQAVGAAHNVSPGSAAAAQEGRQGLLSPQPTRPLSPLGPPSLPPLHPGLLARQPDPGLPATAAAALQQQQQQPQQQPLQQQQMGATVPPGRVGELGMQPGFLPPTLLSQSLLLSPSAGALGLAAPPPSPPPAAMPAASLDAALLLALALLHCWGLDSDADAAVLRMLRRCGVSPSCVGSSGVQGAGMAGQQQPQQAQQALGLVQPVWRDHDSFCMECPLRMRAPGVEGSQLQAQTMEQGSSSTGTLPAASQGLAMSQGLAASQGAAVGGPEGGRGPSWDESSTVHVAELADQERPGAAAARVGAAGHELWCRDGRFVAERLLSMVALAKKMIARHPLEHDVCSPCNSLVLLYTLRLPELLPRLATPDVEVYAAHWQDSNDCVRDAARALMAAATDPSLVSPGHLPPQLQSFEALWPSEGAGLSPEQLQQHSVELLCSAAACLYHDRLVPERLVSITVPCLAELVMHAPSPLAAAAASMLAEGLASPAASHHWSQFLGDLPTFIHRLYHLADRLAAMSAEIAHSPSGLPPATQHQAKPHHPSGHHTASRTATAARHPRIRSHHEPHSRSQGRDGQEREGAGAGARPAAGSVMACRESVGALLSALASLDLRLFLQILGHRLSGEAPPTSPTHLLSFTALIRLMHSARGQQQVAAQLPLLVQSVMRALDPSHAALRRTCLGGVTAVVKELCMRYPHVAYHPDSCQLAVASPQVRHSGGRGGAFGGGSGSGGVLDWGSTGSLSSSSSHGAGAEVASAADPVAVYDLDTGHKTYVLRMEVPKAGGTGGSGELVGLSAICFSSHGDYLMGYSDEEGVALGWRLQRGWAQKLQRGPAVLGPSKMVVVPAAEALRGLHQAAQGQVSLGYSIKFESAGRLRLAHHDVLVYIDLDHA